MNRRNNLEDYHIGGSGSGNGLYRVSGFSSLSTSRAILIAVCNQGIHHSSPHPYTTSHHSSRPYPYDLPHSHSHSHASSHGHTPHPDAEDHSDQRDEPTDKDLFVDFDAGEREEEELERARQVAAQGEREVEQDEEPGDRIAGEDGSVPMDVEQTEQDGQADQVDPETLNAYINAHANIDERDMQRDHDQDDAIEGDVQARGEADRAEASAYPVEEDRHLDRGNEEYLPPTVDDAQPQEDERQEQQQDADSNYADPDLEEEEAASISKRPRKFKIRHPPKPKKPSTTRTNREPNQKSATPELGDHSGNAGLAHNSTGDIGLELFVSEWYEERLREGENLRLREGGNPITVWKGLSGIEKLEYEMRARERADGEGISGSGSGAGLGDWQQVDVEGEGADEGKKKLEGVVKGIIAQVSFEFRSVID